MPIKPWKIQAEEVVFEEWGRKVLKRTYIMPDGDSSDFYLKKEKNTASVVGLTKDNKIILAKQYRPGPDKVLLEIPGGFIDAEDQDPKVAAERELIEETGYKGECEFVATCTDDAYSTVERNLFVAKNCQKICKPELEKTEFAEVVLVTIDEFRELLRSGQMTDVEAGYLALDYLQLLR